MTADLTKLTDEPELAIIINGRLYHFSELPIAAIARLQTWVRANIPHPVDSLKGHLDGLPESVAIAMGQAARQEAKSWPPQVGTGAGAIALLSSEPGQVETLYEGLVAHQPGATREDAQRLYRELTREAARQSKAAKRAGKKYDGEGEVQRIFSVLFGLDQSADPEERLPKE